MGLADALEPLQQPLFALPDAPVGRTGVPGFCRGALFAEEEPRLASLPYVGPMPLCPLGPRNGTRDLAGARRAAGAAA
ncbi:hypothetical protein [Streptomyces sp. NPDC058872]|uniref:hypothetical protein n=1 Tax=Streptomyces sp. NPDC058872 TaxID=3346661 RepID=UPI0036BBA6C2